MIWNGGKYIGAHIFQELYIQGMAGVWQRKNRTLEADCCESRRGIFSSIPEDLRSYKWSVYTSRSIYSGEF